MCPPPIPPRLTFQDPPVDIPRELLSWDEGRATSFRDVERGSDNERLLIPLSVHGVPSLRYSPGLRTLVAHLLRKDPRQRPGAGALLRRPLIRDRIGRAPDDSQVRSNPPLPPPWSACSPVHTSHRAREPVCCRGRMSSTWGRQLGFSPAVCCVPQGGTILLSSKSLSDTIRSTIWRTLPSPARLPQHGVQSVAGSASQQVNQPASQSVSHVTDMVPQTADSPCLCRRRWANHHSPFLISLLSLGLEHPLSWTQ